MKTLAVDFYVLLKSIFALIILMNHWQTIPPDSYNDGLCHARNNLPFLH
jgi:hypothetical protein